MTELVHCTTCDEVPFAVVHDGRLLIRCNCDTGLNVASTDRPGVFPNGWENPEESG